MTAPLSPADLARLRALEAAASPAPWRPVKGNGVDWMVVDAGPMAICTTWRGEPDAALIAAARNALPALLDAAERGLVECEACRAGSLHAHDDATAERLARECEMRGEVEDAVRQIQAEARREALLEAADAMEREHVPAQHVNGGAGWVAWSTWRSAVRWLREMARPCEGRCDDSADYHGPCSKVCALLRAEEEVGRG